MVSLSHAGQDVGLRSVEFQPPPPLTEGGSAAGSTLRQAWPCFCLASMWALLLTAGCTSSLTRMYSGPARPRGEVARLDARMFDVTQIDGTAIQENWQFLEFLPGCHSIGVVLDWREGRKVPQANSGGMTVYGHLEQELSFYARPGEFYLVDLEVERVEASPSDDQTRWKARIVRSRFLLGDQEVPACQELYVVRSSQTLGLFFLEGVLTPVCEPAHHLRCTSQVRLEAARIFEHL
jgi:hypothetical protein